MVSRSADTPARPPRRYWLRIRQMFYALSLIGLLGAGLWADFARPGGIFRRDILTTVASHSRPEDNAPFVVFLFTAVPAVALALWIMERGLVRRRWGAVWLVSMLILVPWAVAVIVHNSL